MSSAHITTKPRHPLVDALIDAGVAVDEVYAHLHGGTEYGRGYKTFADEVGPTILEGGDFLEIVKEWARKVETFYCRVGTTKPLIMSLVATVQRRAQVAADTIIYVEPTPPKPDATELYRVYLDCFVEYLTPSPMSVSFDRSGKADRVEVVRKRHNVDAADVNKLKAQAQGVADAVMLERNKTSQSCCDCDEVFEPTLPRSFDDFCDVVNVEKPKPLN